MAHLNFLYGLGHAFTDGECLVLKDDKRHLSLVSGASAYTILD